MLQDKRKRVIPSRSGVEPYEVNYFAHKHGISVDQTRRLMKKVGNSRERLNKEAAELKDFSLLLADASSS